MGVCSRFLLYSGTECRHLQWTGRMARVARFGGIQARDLDEPGNHLGVFMFAIDHLQIPRLSSFLM